MGSQDGDVYLVVEDSPVFATLFEYALKAFAGSIGRVVRCNSFEDAAECCYANNVRLVVCGYGLGGGKTAHDLRRICDAPMVIMTGRPSGVDAPESSIVLEKSAGPERLRDACAASLG